VGLDVLDGLGSLLDKSLLRGDETGEDPRFTMLDTIREFGVEHLEASGEAREVRAAHARYFLGFAGDANRRLATPEQATWFARLECDQDNLRAALAWARDDAGNEDLGLRLAASLGFFWMLRGYGTAGRSWLREMLALPGSAARTNARVRALLVLGRLMAGLGDYHAAFPVFEECIGIAAELGHARLGAFAEASLSNALLILGDLDAARPHAETATALARDAADPAAEAFALGQLATVLSSAEEFERALAVFDEALALYGRIGDTSAIGGMLNNMGVVAHRMGDLDRAAELWEQSGDGTQPRGCRAHAWRARDRAAAVHRGAGSCPRDRRPSGHGDLAAEFQSARGGHRRTPASGAPARRR
jgi:tetratricopeptide (TPR) repeat protein